MLMQASNQWMRRPADERFTSLNEMLLAQRAIREASRATVASNRRLEARPVEDQPQALIVTLDDQPVVPTHFAFNQLAALVSAPAKYLRQLPTDLTADCLNFGLKTRAVEEVGLLATDIPGGIAPDLRAATGPGYGRIWNDTVIQALIDRFGDGVTGDFTVPGEFGVALDAVTKANTTLFAGDRDMFVFLADEKNRIEVPNRRDGKSGSLARGFFIQNSEVGSSSLVVHTFLFDYACCNRIVWGAQDVKEIRIRHTSGAPDRWLEEVGPGLVAYARGSTNSIVDAVAAAQKASLKDNLDEFLSKRFSKNRVAAIKLAHEADEGRPIETLWDATVGITAYARSVEHQDERVAVEKIGGSLLDLARA